MPDDIPAFIKELKGETPVDYWRPTSIIEWETVKRTEAGLRIIIEMANQERALRIMVAKWIFSLLSGQSIVLFLFICLDASKIIELNEGIIKIVMPTVVGEVFGMAYVVVKYLFGDSIKWINTFLKSA